MCMFAMDWITWWCVFCAALSPAPRLLWICLFLRLTWSGIVQWPPFWPAETFLHVQGASCTADSRCVIAEACPDTCTALTFLLRRITPICVASTSVSGIPHGVCFEADTVFRYSFKILPNRLKLIRLYPCGSLGQSISFLQTLPDQWLRH